jgi:signal transduction histidine kinase
MEFILNPYSLVLLFSGILVAGLSTFIAIKLEDSTRWVALTMISASTWGFFYGLELSSSTKEMMLLFTKLEYIGILLTPAFWLIFCIKYTGLKPQNFKLIVILITIIPLISYVILLTNDIHHLHYAETSVYTSGDFPVLKIKTGPWYLVNVIYSYATFLIGLYILWKRFRFSNAIYKTQNKLIFIAGFFPLLINVLYQVGIIRIYSEIDLTPFAFLFTYSILAFAIIKLNLFSIKPIAKDKIIEAITRGILVIDSKMNIIEYNAAIQTFFEKTDSIKIGNNLRDILNDFQVILNLIKSNVHDTIDVQDGDEENKKIVRIESIPIIERSSSLSSGTVLLFEDITNQVFINETLQNQAHELKQLNDLKDKYFSIISHDLKGPILGVKELIHLTQTGLISQEEFMAMMPEISKNMENVAILLENLLAWTSSQLRGEFIQLTNFDIIQIMVQQKNLLSRIAKAKEINIDLDISKEFWVFADKNMIELVLRNLLNNAVKFSDKKGVIKMSTTEKGDYIKICVEDNGTGISEDNLTKLRKGVSFTTRGKLNETGTGLGLILVSEYVEKNKGFLEINSKLNVGTKFCFLLPKGSKPN